MKRQSVIILCVLFLLIFFLGIPVSAAAPGVSYDGISGEMIYAPGSGRNPQQLFYGFADLRPGDLMVDRIILNCSGEWDANVYLRLDMPSSEGVLPFLSQFNLEIQDGDGRKVFSGTLEKALQWIYIGTGSPGQSQVLEMTLSAPLQTAHLREDFSWRFLGTEVPGDPSQYTGTDLLPQTGDSNIPYLAAAMLLFNLPILLLFTQKIRP